MIAAWILAETSGTVKTVIGFFTRGGLFMWPLLVCSIVSVTTMILRGLALREKNVMPSLIQDEIELLVPGGSTERLSRIVYHDSSSLARITQVADVHIAVDCSATDDSDVLGVFGMNQSAMSFAPSPLPAHIHERFG